MKINAYLNFDGNCEEAIAFYAQCLDGKVESLMRFGETPASIRRLQPRLGEHGREILLEAGLSEDEIRSLVEAGGLRLPSPSDAGEPVA